MSLLGLKANVLAAAFFSLVVLIGVFAELEDVGLNFMVSASFTLLINSLVGAGVFALWVSRAGQKWDQAIIQFLESSLRPLSALSPQFQINYHDLFVQLPSIILILWASALYLAVFLEVRLNGGQPTSAHSAEMRASLAEFRLPDPVVWTFTLALLGAFGNFSSASVEALSINALNVCSLLFFFQGIAVVARAFAAMRMGPVWQFFAMLIIVLHLFVVVSFLGLLDYWLDFRLRLAKRAEQFNREV